MGWKSIGRGLKKAGSEVGKAGAKGIKVAAETTPLAMAQALVDQHGDSIGSVVERVDAIAEAVKEVTDVIPRLDSIDRRVGHLRDTQVTRGTGKRIEKKVDEAILQVHVVRENLEKKVDGITAQLAEIRHFLHLTERSRQDDAGEPLTPFPKGEGDNG